jgi:hypothetical protein
MAIFIDHARDQKDGAPLLPSRTWRAKNGAPEFAATFY